MIDLLATTPRIIVVVNHHHSGRISVGSNLVDTVRVGFGIACQVVDQIVEVIRIHRVIVVPVSHDRNLTISRHEPTERAPIVSFESIPKIFKRVVDVDVSAIVIAPIPSVIPTTIVVGVNNACVPKPRAPIGGHHNGIAVKVTREERIQVPRRDHDVDSDSDLPRIEAVVREEEEVVVPTIVVVAIARSPTVIEEEPVVIVASEDSILTTRLEGKLVSSHNSRRSTDLVYRGCAINANVAIRIVGRSTPIWKPLSGAATPTSAQTAICGRSA